MSRYGARQPKDGDIVAHCPHRVQRLHWYYEPEGGPTFPDGCRATWIAVCDGCDEKLRAGGQIDLPTHATWIGNAPVIEAAS